MKLTISVHVVYLSFPQMDVPGLLLAFYSTTLMFMMLNPAFSFMDYVVQASAILLAFGVTVMLNLNHVWMLYMYTVLHIHLQIPILFAS